MRKDHREQRVFHTHYSYVSGSWKAKKEPRLRKDGIEVGPRERCLVKGRSGELSPPGCTTPGLPGWEGPER